jgi:hypothetical protein
VARDLLYVQSEKRAVKATFTEDAIMVFIVLWLLGVPLGLIVLLWLLGVFS